jgi:hypothetical protein
MSRDITDSSTFCFGVPYALIRSSVGIVTVSSFLILLWADLATSGWAISFLRLTGGDGDPPESNNRFAKRRRLYEYAKASGESVGTMTIRQAQSGELTCLL